jgi:hypothetical protein
VRRTRVAQGRPLVHYCRQFGGFEVTEGNSHGPRPLDSASVEDA